MFGVWGGGVVGCCGIVGEKWGWRVRGVIEISVALECEVFIAPMLRDRT